MNKTYYGIVQLVKSAVTEKPIQLPDEFDWEAAIKLTRLHKLEVMVCCGAYCSNISVPIEHRDSLTKTVHMLTMADVQQQYEINLLSEAFLENGISFMPLKGALIKSLYPKPEMRYMGDADILIKEEEYPQIEKIMTKLGYAFRLESNHEYIWRKGIVNIELHKRLIPSYNEDYYAYYGTGWKLAKLKDKTRYSMTDEDFLIYLVTHLAKHYRDSGIGIKHFVDIWVYTNKKDSLDEEYISAELEKLQLLEFYKNCIKMLGSWFDDKADNEITRLMTEWIFSSGAYGDAVKSNISEGLKDTKKGEKNGQLKYFAGIAFPSYNNMCAKYSWLAKIPILLPLAWLVRIFGALIAKQSTVKSVVKKGSSMTKQNINEYQDALNMVGLDFDFKENKE